MHNMEVWAASPSPRSSRRRVATDIDIQQQIHAHAVTRHRASMPSAGYHEKTSPFTTTVVIFAAVVFLTAEGLATADVGGVTNVINSSVAVWHIVPFQSRVSGSVLGQSQHAPCEQRAACTQWLGRAEGWWAPRTVARPDLSSTSEMNACTLVGDSAEEILAPLSQSATVYFLGNSVTRGLAFTLKALLDGSSMLNREQQQHACGDARNSTLNPRPVGFTGPVWPNYNCGGEGIVKSGGQGTINYTSPSSCGHSPAPPLPTMMHHPLHHRRHYMHRHHHHWQ